MCAFSMGSADHRLSPPRTRMRLWPGGGSGDQRVEGLPEVVVDETRGVRTLVEEGDEHRPIGTPARDGEAAVDAAQPDPVLRLPGAYVAVAPVPGHEPQI